MSKLALTLFYLLYNLKYIRKGFFTSLRRRRVQVTGQSQIKKLHIFVSFVLEIKEH